MTEPDAPPPHDPAQIPPIEQRATPEPIPLEFQLGTGQTSVPPPVPDPSPLPHSAPQATPEPPPYTPAPAAPLPPPYSPPPRHPSPPPFEPEPPFVPPPPPISPPYSGGAQPAPGAAPAPRGTGWAAAAHWTSLFGLGLSCLLIGLIGPGIVWLAKKDSDPEADWHGRESLNFQLNMLLLWLVAIPLYCFCCLGMFVHLLQPIYMVVLVVFASVEALSGKRFRYPFTLRLLND